VPEIASSNIRNIALVDHEGAGETTLLESMIHLAGARNRMGHVAEHNTISDFDPIEIEFERSLFCSTASFLYRGHLFNCLDVPGSGDAIGEALPALQAVECALVCVDAAEGVKVNTRRMWRLAARNHLPRIVALTRLDADKADFDAALAALREEYGNHCIPLYLPDGSGSGFSRLRSLLAASDADLADARQMAIEAIVECDDALMERYLEGEELSAAELMASLRASFIQGALFPVVPTAAEKEIGSLELLDLLAELAPAPGEIERTLLRDGEAVAVDTLDGFTAYVYRTVSDEFVGRISYLRILSGSLAPHASVVNTRSGRSEKVGHIMRVLGKEQFDLKQANAGDIVALPRIADMQAGDLIADGGSDLSMPALKFPMPMVSVAVHAKTQRDEQKLSSALHELEHDDRTFHVHSDAQTRDLIVSGISDLHLQLLLRRLERRYKVSVETSPPQVPYLETITRKAEGIEYTHKKQSGGAGQYGKVVIDIEPLPRGAGYEFVDRIHGGVIDAVFRPAVDKGVQAGMEQGLLAGFPVTDLRVALTDGKTHPVDSKEVAFVSAGMHAFREAYVQCAPVLLEPMARIEVAVAQEYLGDVMSDLNGRRGRILATDMRGSRTALVQAEVPLAELHGYQTQLSAMTRGEGSFTLEMDRYEVVPAVLQKRIVEARKRA